MSNKPASQPPRDEQQPSEEYNRFDNLTRALFRVDKKDVPKHEPVKRNRKGDPTVN